MPKTLSRRRRSDSDFRPHDEPCCCPPRAMLWIDSRAESIFVENQIDMKRRLMVRADANASVKPPTGPDVNADGSGGSQLDEGTLKPQGKIYRTDSYTIHWKAEGQCRPLQVSLDAASPLNYSADSLPEEGQVTLSRTYLLEPPYKVTEPESIEVTLTVKDCSHNTVTRSNRARRP